MFFKNLCVHVLWEKVASELEGLINPFTPVVAVNARRSGDISLIKTYFGKYLKEKCLHTLESIEGKMFSRTWPTTQSILFLGISLFYS